MLSAFFSGVLVASLTLVLSACGGGDDGDDGPAGGSANAGGSAPTGGSGPAGGSSAAGASGASSTGGSSGGGPVSFASDVRPIFAAKCYYCHGPTSPTLVDLTNPFDPDLGIINRPNTWVNSEDTLVVEPGNVENSFLITKVEETELDAHIDGSPMPMIMPMLTDDEFAAVEQWIVDGAEDTEFFQTMVAPVFGTAVSLGRAAGKCTFCHFPGNSHNVNVLDVFGTMVDKRSAYRTNDGPGTIVAPGDPDNSVLLKKLSGDLSVGPQMPYAPPRLTPAEVATLKAWIEQGAEDD
jgi:hypothetical protein